MYKLNIAPIDKPVKIDGSGNITVDSSSIDTLFNLLGVKDDKSPFVPAVYQEYTVSIDIVGAYSDIKLFRSKSNDDHCFFCRVTKTGAQITVDIADIDDIEREYWAYKGFRVVLLLIEYFKRDITTVVFLALPDLEEAVILNGVTHTTIDNGDEVMYIMNINHLLNRYDPFEVKLTTFDQILKNRTNELYVFFKRIIEYNQRKGSVLQEELAMLSYSIFGNRTAHDCFIPALRSPDDLNVRVGGINYSTETGGLFSSLLPWGN